MADNSITAEFTSPSDARMHHQISDWKCAVQMMPDGLLLVAIGACARDEDIAIIAERFGLDAAAMLRFRSESTPRKWNIAVTFTDGQRSLIRYRASPGEAEIVLRSTRNQKNVVQADLVADDGR